MGTQPTDLDAIVAQLEGLAQQVKQIASRAAIPAPAAEDLIAEKRLARLEDKLKVLLNEPKVVRDKPMRTVTPPKRRDEIDDNGTPGVTLLWWADQNLQKICLTRVGYFQRMVHANRLIYRVTPLGRQYFFERPYLACPQFPETFVTKAGEQELKRLYSAAQLTLRTFV